MSLAISAESVAKTESGCAGQAALQLPRPLQLEVAWVGCLSRSAALCRVRGGLVLGVASVSAASLQLAQRMAGETGGEGGGGRLTGLREEALVRAAWRSRALRGEPAVKRGLGGVCGEVAWRVELRSMRGGNRLLKKSPVPLQIGLVKSCGSSQGSGCACGCRDWLE
jgi:hypothetical protein